MLYFGSVYFAAAALVPAFALQVALASLIFGLSAYQYLIIMMGDKPSAPFGLLLSLPFMCIALGIVWWVMRLLGLFGD